MSTHGQNVVNKSEKKVWDIESCPMADIKYARELSEKGYEPFSAVQEIVHQQGSILNSGKPQIIAYTRVYYKKLVGLEKFQVKMDELEEAIKKGVDQAKDTLR